MRGSRCSLPHRMRIFGALGSIVLGRLYNSYSRLSPELPEWATTTTTAAAAPSTPLRRRRKVL
jgi:hypothetical protein